MKAYSYLHIHCPGPGCGLPLSFVSTPKKPGEAATVRCSNGYCREYMKQYRVLATETELYPVYSEEAEQ